MAWHGGFSGVGFTRDEFKAWLKGQTKPSRYFLTAHNTAAPYMRASVSGPARVKNLGHYYQSDLKVSGGPNFFVLGDGKVYLGTPLAYSVYSSPGFNGKDISVEVEGSYTSSFQDPTIPGTQAEANWKTAAWVFAELMAWMGWVPTNDTLKLHKEDPKTTHDCPGKMVMKDWLLALIRAAMGQLPLPEPVHAPQNAVGQPRWVNTPGDTLNLRSAPGGTVKGSIPHATPVTVLLDQGAWAQIKTPAGYVGWVFTKYLDLDDPKTPEVPQPKGPLEQQPGSYSYDEFGLSWAKRFEGLMLTAYWDRNDYAIGYGHNNGSGVLPHVAAGMKITEAEAVDILDRDMDLQLHYVESYVDVPLTQGQVNALCLHIFQQGPGNFREGKVRPLVNAGKHAEAAAAIENWPTTNAGLKRRRLVEAQLYRGELPTKW